MSKLLENSALNGYAQSWDGFEIAELTGYELVSLAVASGKEQAFARQYKSTFDGALPAPNQVLPATGGSSMWLEPGKFLVMLGQRDVEIDRKLASAFGQSAYAVLLSDGWACLRVSGERTLDVFERFMPLDLRNAPRDFATRTSAHHIAVIIVTLLDGSYLLLTPVTSSRSFLEALVHTVETVIS